MAKPTRESVYEEIRKAVKKGKGLSAKSKMSYLEVLLRENKIQKTSSKYYAKEIIPSYEIFATVEESGEKGAALLPLEIHVVTWDGRIVGL
ncbi:MAG: hypothetical protein HXS54_06795 [Theionarchaea archaeon]|nr:hypothetical protein [Theionarchaea archaeon]